MGPVGVWIEDEDPHRSWLPNRGGEASTRSTRDGPSRVDIEDLGRATDKVNFGASSPHPVARQAQLLKLDDHGRTVENR